MRLLILVLSVITFSVHAEEVYKQVGEDGVPTFSDHAMPGAQRVEVEEPVTFSNDVIEQALDRRQEAARDAEEKARRVNYSIEITSPADDEAVRDNAGNLAISVRISTPLQNGHTAELRMDGRRIRTLSGTETVQLNNVDRGTHQFKARVLDQDGDVLAESAVVSVSMLRYAIPRKQAR